jgi:hypothetical protein
MPVPARGSEHGTRHCFLRVTVPGHQQRPAQHVDPLIELILGVRDPHGGRSDDEATGPPSTVTFRFFCGGRPALVASTRNSEYVQARRSTCKPRPHWWDRAVSDSRGHGQVAQAVSGLWRATDAPASSSCPLVRLGAPRNRGRLTSCLKARAAPRAGPPTSRPAFSRLASHSQADLSSNCTRACRKVAARKGIRTASPSRPPERGVSRRTRQRIQAAA